MMWGWSVFLQRLHAYRQLRQEKQTALDSDAQLQQQAMEALQSRVADEMLQIQQDIETLRMAPHAKHHH